ncbi:MAG: lanthionine synthetase C family protein [Bacteroidota bacterium]
MNLELIAHTKAIMGQIEKLEVLDHIALTSAKGGLALYYAYAYQILSEEEAIDKCHENVGTCLEYIGNQSMDTSLSDGITGLGWLLAHLIENELIEIEGAEFMNVFDEQIFKSFETDIETGNYDLLYGLIGKGQYFLQRSSAGDFEKALLQVVEMLAQMSEKTDTGITWPDRFTHKHLANPQVKYNLGLSHGVPSIITFLAKVAKKGIARKQCLELIESSLPWLLGQQTEKHYSRFPHFSDEKEPSRLGWSYGDLGVAIAVWNAARVTERFDLEATALDLVTIACDRTLDNSHSYVLKDGTPDISLCTGASGIALIFNNFYQTTGISMFKQSRDYWHQITMEHLWRLTEMDTHAYDDMSFTPWYSDPGLLNGMAGIGLSIMALESEMPAPWQSLFLTDLIS